MQTCLACVLSLATKNSVSSLLAVEEPHVRTVQYPDASVRFRFVTRAKTRDFCSCYYEVYVIVTWGEDNSLLRPNLPGIKSEIQI